MKNSKPNNSTLQWFNPQLFTFKGAPLKFNLRGYSQTEFYKIVKIIEAYGGVLSTPDAPDTFVFCESDYPVGAAKHNLYDISYFHDTIITLQPRDLINYKFERLENQCIRCPSKENKSINFRRNNKSQKNVTKKSTRNSKRGHYRKHNVGYITEEDNQTIIKWLKKKNFLPSKTGTKVWIQLLIEKVLPHRNLTVGNLLGHFNRELSKHPDFVKYSNDLTASGRIYNSNSGKECTQGFRYNEMENRAIVQYIIDNNAYRRAKNLAFWVKFLEANKASLHKTRTASALQSHYLRRLYWKFTKYTDNPEALRRFKGISRRSIKPAT